MMCKFFLLVYAASCLLNRINILTCGTRFVAFQRVVLLLSLNFFHCLPAFYYVCVLDLEHSPIAMKAVLLVMILKKIPKALLVRNQP